MEIVFPIKGACRRFNVRGEANTALLPQLYVPMLISVVDMDCMQAVLSLTGICLKKLRLFLRINFSLGKADDGE